MLVVFGSVALDTIRTPTKTLRCQFGGAATFASISASFFTKTGLLAVVGSDFPKKYSNVLAKRINLSGLNIKKGKTFHYDGRYDKTLQNRTTLKTELNVLDGFKATVPDKYKRSKFVYLANNDPEQNIRVLGEFEKVKFSMCDTIDFWIHTKRAAVKKMIAIVDAVVINDEEARLLVKEHNLVRCAKKISKMGAKYVIIKKAEHGALFFYEDTVFASPGFPIPDPVDPTGAGDSFAGAIIGYMANANSSSPATIKKAITYGNVMGSIVVQGYGTAPLLRLKKATIEKRAAKYHSIVCS
ncbi:MAG: Ribokinase-like protein [Cenarchaeum symbiont of Oopsacas minuta]|nr:Ribokinase-like protein [Cenarchaeum symbiont of Oopsacas minuta]